MVPCPREGGKKRICIILFPTFLWSHSLPPTACHGLLLLSSVGNVPLFQILASVEAYLFWIPSHFLSPGFTLQSFLVSLGNLTQWSQLPDGPTYFLSFPFGFSFTITQPNGEATYLLITWIQSMKFFYLLGIFLTSACFLI